MKAVTPTTTRDILGLALLDAPARESRTGGRDVSPPFPFPA